MNADKAVAQIAEVLDLYKVARAGSQHDDLSDCPPNERMKIITRIIDTIERLAPSTSAHKRQVVGLSSTNFVGPHLLPIALGILQALHEDYKAGNLSSSEELVRAEVFGDFLEMADYLLLERYKDAACVLIGGVLEIHLRKLCDKHGVSTAINNKPKKADTLNADLAKARVLDKLDQKNVTAWLGLRNLAAHGEYDKYNLDGVKLFLQSIRDFVARLPA